MVAAVTDAELAPTVGTERDVLVVDPRHHRLFNCFGKDKINTHTPFKKDLVREIEKE